MKKTSENKTEKSHISDDVSDFYEIALDQVLEQTRKGGSFMSHLVNEVGENVSALESLSKDKVVLLKNYLKRDLTDAATYLSTTGKTLQDWLGFDIALIESKLWLNFAEAADQTTLELIKLQEQASLQTYHTGESVGVGTLQCDQCGAQLHFHRPARIPPCGKCHHTEFHRQTN
jgi:ribosomal protein S27AE